VITLHGNPHTVLLLLLQEDVALGAIKKIGGTSQNSCPHSPPPQALLLQYLGSRGAMSSKDEESGDPGHHNEPSWDGDNVQVIGHRLQEVM
jgi:hypothetical protein